MKHMVLNARQAHFDRTRMAQTFQNNRQRAFEAQNFNRNFGNNFDTVVVSGFSRQFQPGQIV